MPLAKSALQYAKVGLTSIDEVLKLVEMVTETAQSHQKEPQKELSQEEVSAKTQVATPNTDLNKPREPSWGKNTSES